MRSVTVDADETSQAAAAPAARRPRSAVRRWRGPLLRLGSVVVLLAAWQLYGQGADARLFAPPSAVVQAAAQMAASGELAKALGQSLSVFGIGLALAIVIGIGLGLAMGRSRIFEALLDVPLNALYAMPMVAMVPVVVLWTGFGPVTKVVVVFLFAVFSIVLNTARGVREVDAQLIEVARSYLASEAGLWRDVVLPSALPYIVTGVRLAVGRALVGVIVAEFYTAIAGLGNLIVTYANSFQTAKVFVPVVVLMALGVLLTGLLQLVERAFAPWQTVQEGT
jgi:ABC-type nitrate/sulfonate/bicarbonate transport system permease component